MRAAAGKTRLIACVSWYDEPVRALQELVTSLAGVCDHLVAVDGAYALYPHTDPASPSSQRDTIKSCADSAGIPLTLHVPTVAFAGNEVEKRSLLMQLGCDLAETDRDWLLVLDGDMSIAYADPGLRQVLAGLAEDVADYWLCWPTGLHNTAPAGPRPRTAGSSCRGLFRALPGLRVQDAHYTYVAERDGQTVYLRGHHDFHPVEPAATVEDLLQVDHLTLFRPHARCLAASTYYEQRDTEAAETVRRPLRLQAH